MGSKSPVQKPKETYSKMWKILRESEDILKQHVTIMSTVYYHVTNIHQLWLNWLCFLIVNNYSLWQLREQHPTCLSCFLKYTPIVKNPSGGLNLNIYGQTLHFRSVFIEFCTPPNPKIIHFFSPYFSYINMYWSHSTGLIANRLTRGKSFMEPSLNYKLNLAR